MISNLEKLTPDALFELHAEITAVLAEKLKAKKADLDAKLRQLQPVGVPVTPALSAGKGKISEPRSTNRNLVRTWQVPALARREAKDRRAAR
jgi:hypothetical protein